MRAPTSPEDALKELDELTEFLGRVKDGARLRAKEEDGVTFLHTRTGTIFGRIIKRLTMSWPEAKAQRNLARQLVANVLARLSDAGGVTGQSIRLLKDQILNETLMPDSLEEFSIDTLRYRLQCIRTHLSAESQKLRAAKSLASPAQEGNPLSVDTNFPAAVLAEEKSEKNVQAPEPAESAESPEPTAAQPVTVVHEQNSTSAIEKIEELASAPAEKSSFGCFKLGKSLSASSTHRIEAYQADAYIVSTVPGKEDTLKFKLGITSFDSGTALPTGIHLFTGTHTFGGEKRDIRKLQLRPLAGSDEDAFMSMTRERQTQYLKELHQLYTNALTQAFDDGARTFALQALRKPYQLLTPEEIDMLAKAIKAFQQAHPEAKIQVLLERQQELLRFNDQISTRQ